MRRYHAHVVWLVATGLASADTASYSLKPLPEAQWSPAAAAHLLRRAGFGGSVLEVDRLSQMTLRAAVDELVDYERIAFTAAPPPFPAELLEPVDRAAYRALSESERQRAQAERRRLERRAFEETRLWWLERMLRTPRPLEERMTLFWHGHFTSGMREVRNPVFMKEQNELLRRHALDSFGELLLAISKDRAMLVYLDGNRNVKTKPNENYGRELLELFTMGEGNYSESDIKAAARAFTGWGYNEFGFQFRPRQHDGGRKTFLGRGGAWDGDDILRIILQHPACARYLATTLLEYFVRPDPEKQLVDALAAEIRRHEYNMRPVMRTLLMSEAFYHEHARGSLVKSPIDVIIGTARQLDIQPAGLFAIERALAIMGQELMQPPNVKGWDGGETWINTATLFTRYNVVGVMIHGEGGRRPAAQRVPNDELVAIGDATMMRDEPMEMTAQSRLNRSARQASYDPLPLLRRAEAKTAEQVVDCFVAHLLAHPLSPPKRAALVDYLGKDFDPERRGAADRVRTMVHLLCSAPEFQLN